MGKVLTNTMQTERYSTVEPHRLRFPRIDRVDPKSSHVLTNPFNALAETDCSDTESSPCGNAANEVCHIVRDNSSLTGVHSRNIAAISSYGAQRQLCEPG